MKQELKDATEAASLIILRTLKRVHFMDFVLHQHVSNIKAVFELI